MRSHQGFTLVEVLLIAAVIGVIALIAIPGMFPARRGNTERNASTSLKTVSSAEADFRANDRDWNHVNDFWTADVKSLYTLTSAAVQGATPDSTNDQSIKLIELSVASADADGTHVSAGGENVPLTLFAVSSPKAGYWFGALTADHSVGKGPEAEYRQDTKGTPPMGRVHRVTQFGFVAFPDSASAGKYVFMVNENNTIFRSPTTTRCKTGTANPPGLSGVPPAYLNWPSDADLKAHWIKID